MVASAEDEKLIKSMQILLSNDLLLKKQTDSQNAAIPHQNNVFEAEQILKNQQSYYSFITDEFIEKVVQIISFRIPYYIGPLGDSKYSWLERKFNENITPWNFNEKVDKSKSAAQFIERMTNHCTYLKDEKVIPKNSLLYQKYELLNELNCIQLKSPYEPANKKFRLDFEIKEWIIENVFKKYKTVTHKKLLEELKKAAFDELNLDEELKIITGTQKSDRFNASLSSHLIFKELLPDESEEVIEQIIYWLTVFNEKEIIRQQIKQFFPHIMDEKISKLCNLKLTGWGRLSKKVLSEIPVNDQDTLIDYMYKHSENFMEILSKTDLKNKIQQINKKNIYETQKIRYEDIHSLAGSPALKRGIWRAIKIVEELTAIFGEPQSIMIEVAREDQKSTQPKSRKQIWEDLSKEWKNNEDKQFNKNMSSYSEKEFQDKRFWLYATQLGKCLYTGKPLDINSLHTYDIDHILPRNFVKDDSIDNLALVVGSVNKEKNFNGKNQMPLEVIPIEKQYIIRSYWERLYEMRLISKKKYELLLKPTFDEIDKEKFISRQLVETRQIIQNVKDLLQERFVDTSIHLVKAGVISKFRKSLELPKIRSYNNKHHAIDALLTVLLIQFIQQKYGHNFLEFSFKKKDMAKKWSKIAHNSKEFFVFKDFKDSSFQSIVKKNEVLGLLYVKEIFHYIPWQTTKMTGNTEGQFYKETPYSPKAHPNYFLPSEQSKAVFDGTVNENIWVIQYAIMKKNKKIYSTELFDYRVIDKYKYANLDPNKMAKILVERKKKEEIIEVQVLKVLPKYQKIIWNDHPFYLISTKELHNAKQWVMKAALLEKLTALSRDLVSLNELKNLFEEIANDFYDNYVIFNTELFKSKVKAFVEKELVDFEAFEKGLNELYKSAAANATRSDKFGSRLAKAAKANEIKLVYESVTGLNYRKPRNI